MQRLIKCLLSRVQIKDSGLTWDVDDETSPFSCQNIVKVALKELIIKRNALT